MRRWPRMRRSSRRRGGTTKAWRRRRPTWDVSTRLIPRRCGHRCRGSGTSRCPPERRRPGVPDRRPRGTFIRGPSRTVRRADALAWMAERMFESGDAPALAPDRHEIVVHVEAEVLADGRAGRCEIEHRTSIAAETARRLCCDAGIVPVVDGANGEPLSVGRRTRSIPPAVRRALSSRDCGCRFPGCTATYRLHGHHVKHWANGGETSLDNLILLCPTHHRLVHEGGFDVQRLDDGAFRFTNPHGLAIKPAAASRNIITRHQHHPERRPRPRHRLRDRDRALARGAHRLRPCADGDDGVLGFGRYPSGGWADGRRLESVVGEGRRACGQAGPCRAPARSW